ncbi:unnamed protein product [Blepharisma stoltei]|uniref:Uncharacterized protein n=1 Tax=Blepharisma stoltei TaxID=1481888 RepID=A0AAU9J5B5_9CILI|nr:unnamed protein product [Blepharisma stoltei]
MTESNVDTILSRISEVSEQWESSEGPSPCHNNFRFSKKSVPTMREALWLIQEENENELHSPNPSKKITVDSAEESPNDEKNAEINLKEFESKLVGKDKCSCACTLF